MSQDTNSIVFTAERSPTERSTERNNYVLYENSTYMVVSKVAYLIGVPKRIFDNEYEPPQLEWYEMLQKDKNARIIRNLCLLRNAIERNFRDIDNAMRFQMKSLLSLPEYVPVESINELSEDGINVIRSNARLVQYVIDINGHISNRINNCKSIFPIWLK